MVLGGVPLAPFGQKCLQLARFLKFAPQFPSNVSAAPQLAFSPGCRSQPRRGYAHRTPRTDPCTLSPTASGWTPQPWFPHSPPTACAREEYTVRGGHHANNGEEDAHLERLVLFHERLFALALCALAPPPQPPLRVRPTRQRLLWGTPSAAPGGMTGMLVAGHAANFSRELPAAAANEWEKRERCARLVLKKGFLPAFTASFSPRFISSRWCWCLTRSLCRCRSWSTLASCSLRPCLRAALFSFCAHVAPTAVAASAFVFKTSRLNQIKPKSFDTSRSVFLPRRIRGLTQQIAGKGPGGHAP